jgi:hypothetical protein
MTSLRVEELTQKTINTIEPVAIGHFRDAYYTDNDMRKMFRAGFEAALKWSDSHSHENEHYLVHDGTWMYIAKKVYDEDRDQFYWEESHHGERIDVKEFLAIPFWEGQQNKYYKKKEKQNE